jgi:hypothetical protein
VFTCSLFLYKNNMADTINIYGGGCESPEATNIVQINEISISSDLKKLNINVETCGEFSQVVLFLGDDYVNADGEPDSDYGNDITDLTLDASGNQSSNIQLELTPEQVYRSLPKGSVIPDIINDFVVVHFEVERCWSRDDDGYMVLNTCSSANADTKDVQELAVGVASFGKIYPCLAYKILTLEDDCTSCSSMDDVLTLDLLLKAVTLYLKYDRLAEGWYAYEKATKLCTDYDEIYATGATACDLWGGIGCWIIDDTFRVYPSIR